MIITYQRPDTFAPHQLDPNAPAADLSPTGAECGTTTFDVAGIQWHCTRAPHPGQDAHSATIAPGSNGPTGAVAIAWTYQYATDEHDADTDEVPPAHSITITLSFPDRAARGIDTDAVIRTMINAGLDHFWEGDLEDVKAESTARS